MWYPKEKADLKMIHDENDLLTNDELVVARGILRESNMRVYIYEMMKEEIEKKVITEEEKKIITPEKHPGRVTQGHKLSALMKKKKEEILHNKEHSTVQSTEHSSIQSTEQTSVHSRVQSNYVYGVGLLAVRAIDACVFFAYNTLPENKKIINEKQDQQPKRRYVFRPT